MENKYLKNVQKNLKGFFCYFKAENVLVVSEDKSVMPFAYIIADELNYPDTLLLSVAVDFPFAEKVVHVALCANRIQKVALTDQFFIGQNGVTYMGEEADKYYEIETECPLEEIEPLCSNVH